MDAYIETLRKKSDHITEVINNTLEYYGLTHDEYAEILNKTPEQDAEDVAEVQWATPIGMAFDVIAKQDARDLRILHKSQQTRSRLYIPSIKGTNGNMLTPAIMIRLSVMNGERLWQSVRNMTGLDKDEAVDIARDISQMLSEEEANK